MHKHVYSHSHSHQLKHLFKDCVWIFFNFYGWRMKQTNKICKLNNHINILDCENHNPWHTRWVIISRISPPPSFNWIWCWLRLNDRSQVVIGKGTNFGLTWLVPSFPNQFIFFSLCSLTHTNTLLTYISIWER